MSDKSFLKLSYKIVFLLAVFAPINSAFGVTLPLGDDDFENVLLDFTFNFQGVDYNDIYVGSNGYITFGAGDTDLSESSAELLSQEPRVAALWDDLRPTGTNIVDATGDASSMLVSWINVPEYFSTGSNTFSIELFATGVIEIVYGNITANDGLVGISPGGGLASDPGETDFSASSGVFPNVGVFYERFFSGNDLSGLTLRFEPNNTAVPEPGTFALLLLGVVGVFAGRYRQGRGA